MTRSTLNPKATARRARPQVRLALLLALIVGVAIAGVLPIAEGIHVDPLALLDPRVFQQRADPRRRTTPG
jgi:hypothetical protein